MFSSLKRSNPETRHNPYIGYLFFPPVKQTRDVSTQTDERHLRSLSVSSASSARRLSSRSFSSWFFNTS